MQIDLDVGSNLLNSSNRVLLNERVTIKVASFLIVVRTILNHLKPPSRNFRLRVPNGVADMYALRS